jgi:hypothetical protein
LRIFSSKLPGMTGLRVVAILELPPNSVSLNLGGLKEAARPVVRVNPA